MIGLMPFQCYGIAMIVSIVTLFLKAKMFCDQLRCRRSEFAFEAEVHNDQSMKLQKHKQRLAKTKRRILLVYSSMLVGLAKYVPTLLLSKTDQDCWH